VMGVRYGINFTVLVSIYDLYVTTLRDQSVFLNHIPNANHPYLSPLDNSSTSLLEFGHLP
jgi:hypothetical protein